MRIILLLLSSCMLLFGRTLAQNRNIHGKVTDEKGTPLANVSIFIKGSTKGTTTQSDGTFSLPLTPNAKVLVVSSIGFAKSEFSVGNRDEITITLTSSADKRNWHSKVPAFGISCVWAGAGQRSRIKVR